MPLSRILIANRGEIAVRIARGIAEYGAESVTVFSADDAASPHVHAGDFSIGLAGVGTRAFLDISAILAAAKETDCDAIHPGYGFLSENADFAATCEQAGITFIGPTQAQLALFGDKARARAFAQGLGIPLLEGIAGPATVIQVKDFMARQSQGSSVMIKAVAGGGGRGMRVISTVDEADAAFAACEAEALASFGSGALYAERYLERARHIEVQILGDGTGDVSHVWERDCTLQRRNQKLIEIAPARWLPDQERELILVDATKMAAAARYLSLGTFEFLVDADSGQHFFIEANPRLQVEHTVTEQICGIDLVVTQLELANGASLAALGLTQSEIPRPKSIAIQARVNLETMDGDGKTMPTGGTLSVFEPPTGPSLRVDTFGSAGYTTSPHFDSLIAKVIVTEASGNEARAVAKLDRALASFRIEGVASNIGFLRAILQHDAFVYGNWTTQFVAHEATKLFARSSQIAGPPVSTSALGAQNTAIETPSGTKAIFAPLRGTLVGIEVRTGETVRSGQTVAVLEAMKMQHVVTASFGGVVHSRLGEAGETIADGAPLVFILPDETGALAPIEVEEIDLDSIRPDLAEVLARQAATRDAMRPGAVAKRRKTGQRTARENVDDLVDPGSFTEYGSLVLAAQRRRRTVEELIDLSPADGLVMGIGSVNGEFFDETQARAAVLAYDYTVMAGTQGHANHKKTDRMLELASHAKLPVIWFCEGGGGRPGDTVESVVAGLDVTSFRDWAAMSGLVPRIGINSGRCFAGNAVMFGLSDVTIATANSTIGLGGPAMIEGGGLGVFTPDEVGPMAMQTANGVVDIAVADEAEAVAAAKKWLSYFQGPLKNWQCADQRLLRQAIPENRLRVYDLRSVIETLVDTGSYLELRRGFGAGMVTGLIRIEGRPMGLMANDPMFLGGAIDSDGADKAARFMQLCDAFDLPILSLCDTPGFMVGPDSEATAAVRKGSRMFVAAASLSVPVFTVILRKGYGLGAQAMAAGSFGATFFTVAWPTGEIGGMGLEGAVRLGYRKELAAEPTPQAQQALFAKFVARLYEGGKAMSAASVLEIDDVIDPMNTRKWILSGLKAQPETAKQNPKKRNFIDTW